MIRSFQLSLPGFRGPIETLQLLVAARKVQIDDLRLADIPTQYLAGSECEGTLDLAEAGEVLAGGARLLLLKSAHLLAEPLENEEIEVVRERAEPEWAKHGAGVLGAIEGLETFPSPGRPALVPRLAEPRSSGGLIKAWVDMSHRSAGRAARAVLPPFMRLEVAVSRLISRLHSGRVSLSELLCGGSREDAVIHFLAMLELARRGEVEVSQSDLFGAIILRREADVDDRRRTG